MMPNQMKIAIVDANILATIGLKQILHTVMPMAQIDTFGTFVLSTPASTSSQLTSFHCLCINQSEEKFVKDLLTLEQNAHAHGRNLPPHSLPTTDEPLLSQREVEVLSHIAYGKTNKEIAEELCISIATVVSHRKNIMDKLNIRNLSSLTIYAVMHGYVDVSKI